MKRKLCAGLTSVTLPIMIYDSSSSTGGGLGSIVYNTSGLVAEYRRQGQNTWTAIALSAGTLGTWSSGGFVADGSLAGAYEIGLPNAVTASGARWVAIRLYGATNMVPCPIEIELDVVNYQDANFGLSNVTTNVMQLNGKTVDVSLVAGGSVFVGTYVGNLTAMILVGVSGNANADVQAIKGTAQTAIDIGANYTTARAAKLDFLDASILSRSTYAGGAVASVTAPVTVGSNTDKTGYVLHATGLDQISVADPGPALNWTTFPKIMVALFRSVFGKSDLTSTHLKTYADDGATVNSSQAVSDDGVTQTRGSAL